MPSLAGSAIRLLATTFYALEFCCAGIILGIYSYFLAVLANRGIPIARDWKAVEGLSGVAVVYTIFAILLTCFLGGISFFAFVAIVLNICFVGAFIALAVLTRNGNENCSANPITPITNTGMGYGNGFGSGNGNAVTYAASPGLACRLNKACFAVSIVGAVLFLISAGLQVWVSRHAKKENRFGPSPANNYTSGSGSNKRKFWQRKPKSGMQDKDTEMSPAGEAMANNNGTATLATDSSAPAHYHTNSTGYTNSNSYSAYTPNQPSTAAYDTTQQSHTAYGAAPQAADHAGYHTGPVGTSVNPYAYDTSRPTASNF